MYYKLVSFKRWGLVEVREAPGGVFEGDIGASAFSFPSCLHEVNNFVVLCTCLSDRNKGHWLKGPGPESSETDPDKASLPLSNILVMGS